MWNVPVRFLVIWSPLVAVSVGGGIYLFECTQTLFSPGTGFKVDLPPEMSSLKVECKTYSFDPFQQTLIVERLVIRKSNGTILARVPKFVMTGIVVDGNFAPKLQLKDAELWVDRDATGDLDVLNLFKKSDSSPSQQPWQVSIRDSVIHLSDKTGPIVLKNDFEIQDGNFAGMADHFEGGATVNLPGLLKGQIGFKKSGDNIEVSGKKLSGQIAPILARFRAGKERELVKAIDPLRIASGTANGDLFLDLSKSQPKFLVNVNLKTQYPQWDTYRADALEFTGTISEKGLVGKSNFRDKKLSGTAEGTFSYETKPTLGANVKVSGLTPSYLETLKLKLPKDISFVESSSEGFLSYNAGKFGWKGKSVLGSAQVYGLKLNRVEGDVTVEGDQLVASIRPTPIGSTIIEGNFGLNFKTNAIVGAFSSPQINANDFSRWLPTNTLGSKARLVGLIDGTLSKPNILVKGTLDPKIKLANRILAFNSADVVLRFDGTTFNLDRLKLTENAGSIYASGSIDLKKGIDVRVVGNNIDLAKYAVDTSGKFDVQGQVSGTLSDPRYGGKIQGYRIGYSGIPGTIVAVASEFVGNNKSINFKDLTAMKGASQIAGSLGIGFADQKLSGLFAVNGIDVTDIYAGPVGGFLDLKDITIGGTLDKPLMSGSFDAKRILAYNFSADSAKGKITYDGEKFRISESSAQVSSGTVSDISGELVAQTLTGKLSAKFQKLDLTDISQSGRKQFEDNKPVSDFLARLAIKGATSGSFEVGINDGKLSNLTSNGRVDDVFLNKATIGSGDWDASFDGKKWTGNAFIGTLAEYFRIDSGLYEPASGAIGGEFLSYQIPLKELIGAVEPVLKLSPENEERLELVNGKLGSLAKISGSLDKPFIDIPDFEISAIKLDKEDIGTFSFKGSYENETFSIKDGLLVGPKQNKIVLPFIGKVTLPDNLAIPNGTAKIDGTIENAGNLNISGTVFGFPISKFKALAPSLADTDVFVNQANFNLKGSRQQTELSSHIQLSAGFAPEGKNPKTGILASRLKFEGDINVKPDSDRAHVDSTGTFKFRSLEGTLGANFFWDTELGKIDPKQKLLVSAKLNGERDVTEFFQGTKRILLGEKGAQASGGFELSNNIANPILKGGLDFKLDSVKITDDEPIIGKPIDTILKNILLSVTAENDAKAGNVLRAKASTASSYSKLDATIPDLGTVQFDAKLPITDQIKALFAGGNFDLANREILDGSLAFKNFGLYQSFTQNTFAQGTIITEKGNPIKISGTLMKPKISGSIFFDDIKTIIPTLLATNSSNDSAPIDPEIDLKFFTLNPMSIKSTLINLDAKGTGSAKGTLSDLKVDGVLTVEKGDLFLPGGKVKLSPEGTLTLRYNSSSFDSHAQLDANLHGETSLTALKNNTTPERYDIYLDITGDLLASDGLLFTDSRSTLDPIDPRDPNKPRTPGDNSKSLRIVATSQPGDLSPERIRQLLDRTDILSSILQTGVNSSIQRDLKETGISFILPTLFGGITNELQKSFHLDYVGVDYNAFEQTSVTIVKNIGNGFFFQGRQQLFQPLPGQPVAYDFRLTYRPRRGPNSLRALSFSLGSDQLRPYKFSIDFTYRIRTRNPPYQSIKLYVPNK